MNLRDIIEAAKDGLYFVVAVVLIGVMLNLVFAVASILRTIGG